MFAVGGSLLKFVDFPLVKNFLTLPQRIFGFHGTQKLSLIKITKGRCPKALDDFADISVLCKVGRFTYAFCYQFLMIFRCFGIFPLDGTCFFTFILPGSRDILQVVQNHSN